VIYRLLPLFLLAAACSSHGPSSWSEVEEQAVNACLAANPEAVATDDVWGDIDQSAFDRLGEGRFEFKYPAWNKEYDFAWICEGDTTSRRIFTIRSGDPSSSKSISANRSF
jgi:hypothetical protein